MRKFCFHFSFPLYLYQLFFWLFNFLIRWRNHGLEFSLKGIFRIWCSEVRGTTSFPKYYMYMQCLFSGPGQHAQVMSCRGFSNPDSNFGQWLIQTQTLGDRTNSLTPTMRYACQGQEMISTKRELDIIQTQHADINQGQKIRAPIQQYWELRCLDCDTRDVLFPDITPGELIITRQQEQLPCVVITSNYYPHRIFSGF